MAGRKKNLTPTVPAEGERVAIGGYAEQYRASAFLILRSLEQQTLERIRLADPAAGRVDDFQLESAGQVDAYQFKWSRYRGRFSFSNLQTRDDTSPPLIQQLSDGWKLLCSRFPAKRVMVHLVSNDLPSDTDRKLGRSADGRRLHFAAFLAEAWEPVHAGSRSIPPDWHDAWESLRGTTELPQSEFLNFVECCSLDLGWTDPSQDSRPSLRRVDNIEEDIRTITERLFSTVASNQRVIELTADELLTRLGWQGRLGLRNIHRFPDPQLGYCEITATVTALRDAVDATESGYLGLIGTPGSGKSTLVSKSLTTLKHRVVRYYSFVLDAPTSNALRGESIIFLHDLVTLLSEYGFRGGPGLVRNDRLELLSRLSRQMGEAHDDWQKTGRKTVIVVDGLDHIPREQTPERSLLADLPAPNDIPAGVIFLLGTQTIELRDLSVAVRRQLEAPERVLTILPIPRATLLDWLESLPTSAITTFRQRERIFERTGGHPLAVNLLLRHCEAASTTEEIDAILSATTQYEGTTDALYAALWEREIVQVSGSDGLRRLLAFVSRLRNGFDRPLLTLLAGQSSSMLSQFVKGWLHLFRADGERWLPFHNSVRLFLVRKTSEDAFGQFQPDIDHGYHANIAEILARLPADDSWSWELVYHLHEACQHAEVLRLVQATRVRQQLSAFRPCVDVRDEVMRGIRSAKALNDVHGLVRLLFVMLELESRSENLGNSNCDLTARLLQLAAHDGAMLAAARAQLRSGHYLRVGSVGGLQAAEAMLRLGVTEEARKLFELSEPWSVLKDTRVRFDHIRSIGDLETWAKVAPHFRSLGEIEAVIEGMQEVPWLRQPVQDHSWNQPPSFDEIRLRLVYQVGLTAIGRRDRATIDRVCVILRDAQARGWLIDFLRNVALSYRDTDTGFARRCATQAAEFATGRTDLSDDALVRVAELCYRILDDRMMAHRFIEGIGQPDNVRDRGNSRFSELLARFRFNRLLYLFGDRTDIADVVPDAAQAVDQPMIYLERAVVTVARLWARAWLKEPLTPGLFLFEAKPLLQLFNSGRNASMDHRAHWHSVLSLQASFARLLIDAAAQHGSAYITELAHSLASNWNFDGHIWVWPPSVVIEVLKAFWRHGYDWTFCRQWLKRMIEITLKHPGDVTSRISDRDSVCDALLEFGEVEQAKSLLRDAIRLSAGIGYSKDLQMDAWLEWAAEANRADPAGIEARIRFLLRAVLSLRDSTEGPAAYNAAKKLIAIAYDWSPRSAVQIVQLLAEQGTLGWPDGVREFLIRAAKDSAADVPLTSAIIRNILMPISGDGAGELCRDLIARTANPEQAKALCLSCRESALTLAPSVARPGWLKAIDRSCDSLGVKLPKTSEAPPPSDSSDGEHNQHVSKLQLVSDEELAKDDALQRITDVESFLALVKQQKDKQYFPWREWFTSWIAAESQEWVQRLLNGLQQLDADHGLQIACLERLATLTPGKPVFDATAEFLHKQDASGWDRWWSGGYKTRAAKLMAQIDQHAAFPILFDELASDLLSGENRWYSIATHLTDILPCLHSRPSSDRVWLYIEDYLSACFAHLEEAAPILSRDPGRDSANAALLDLVDFAIGHPARILANGARRVLLEVLPSELPELEEPLRSWLSTDDERCRACLTVLTAHAQSRSKIIAVISDIAALANSRDVDIRMLASGIGETTRLFVPSVPIHDPSLMVHYQTRPLIDARSRLDDRPRISSTQPLEDTFDPRELIRPFFPEAKVIADAAHLSGDFVLQRAYELMRSLADEATWNEEGETRLRENCDTMELSFRFRRPRTQVARRALLRVAGELIDAGRITGDAVTGLHSLLRTSDPGMECLLPRIRPQSVSLPEWPESRSDREAWLSIDAGGAQTHFAITDGDWVIVAESSKWQRGPSHESRQSLVHIATSERIANSAPNRLLSRRVKERRIEYFQIAGVDDDELAIQNLTHDLDVLGDNWLAFNPVLARRLRWHPSPDGLFAWTSEEKVVTKSIWWMDGHPDFRQRYHDDCAVGSGWLVVVARSSMKELVDNLGPLERSFVLTRTLLRQEGNETPKTAFWTEKLT